LLESWNDFISPSTIANDYGQDIAYEEFGFRVQQATKIFNRKLKEAKDTETKQKVNIKRNMKRNVVAHVKNTMINYFSLINNKYGLC
jgi:hypothetical protein